MNIEQAHKDIQSLRAQIAHALIGQKTVLDQAIVCLLSSGHALVEGVPGLGKTLLVKALAKACGGDFSRVQFTPDLMPTDITGHTLYDMSSQKWEMRKGPIFCNFLLADEINRAPAKTQSALLEVMQEHQVTIEGESHHLNAPFLVLATQNPAEQEGTYPLPEAQLDRFLLNVKMDYPSAQEETDMVSLITGNTSGDKLDISKVETVLSPMQIIALQTVVSSLEVDQKIVDYAVAIVRATREWNGIEEGAGPRGSLALLRASRAQALLAGNHFVTPDDIKHMSKPVLRHRIKLTADLEIEGYKPDQVLDDILNTIEAPRV